MAFDLRDFLKPRDGTDAASADTAGGPLGGTRSERLQRLQVGVFGIGFTVLLLGLADIVGSQVRESEASAVPEAAPTVASSETPAPTDPFVEAGVAPQLPAEPEPTGSSAPQQDAREDVPEPATNAQLQ